MAKMVGKQMNGKLLKVKGFLSVALVAVPRKGRHNKVKF